MSAKLAPITIVAGNEELERIESEMIMRVLVIEDDPDVRDRTVRRLKDAGFSVDAFSVPREAARYLLPNEYQLVIVDIRFDEPNISGDEFIFKNQDVFEEAKIVAFTGHAADIVHGEVFDSVFLKGAVRDTVFEYAEQRYRERQHALAIHFKSELTADSKAESDKVSSESRGELLRVLLETKDRDTKLVWYKGRDFSANELIEEVKDDQSVVGKSHLKMMAGWLLRKRGKRDA